MPTAPHGTVTFLFTDVEGSTRLWEQWPEAMRAALAAHDRVLRTVVEAHDGYVFSTAGDAFAVAFWTPEAAARAALAAQRDLAREAWPEPVEVRVRMGLHTGTADERDGDYFGPAVNRAARIMSAGHGGQVLASLATEELARDRLGEGVDFLDLGIHPLSGLSRPEQVFQLVAPGLGVLFPPLRTASPTPGNLPMNVTSFVGRQDDIARVVADLGPRRLVTLVGVGGVGKTRLALEAARTCAAAHRDGVWFCELAPVAEPEAVAHTVASTLTVRPQAGLSMVDSVVDALRGRELLLVLDNCEHVLDGAAEVTTRVNGACPTVTVLATSREPIGVPGEWVLGIAPLPGDVGVALFRDRTAAADAPAAVQADETAIRAICERLDGLPLAIELAAARAASMTLPDLTDRLVDRFRLLRRRRGVSGRHQTLRATVEWSYQLLAKDERVVFDRLSVFAGGCELAAAEAVAGTEPVVAEDVADILAALVEKSMAIADRSGDRTRFRLLETLRQYGQEQLALTGSEPEVRDRHLAHHLAVAVRAQRQVKGTEYDAGMATFEAEWDNLRVALQWAVANGDVPAATAIVEATFMFALWRQRHELGDWAEQVIALDGAGPAAYGIASKLWWLRGEHSRAVELARAGIAISTPDTFAGLRICTDALGRSLWFSGQLAEGWAAMQAFSTMFDPDTEPFDAGWALLALTGFAQRMDPGQLDDLIARAREIAAPLDNPALETLAGLASNWAAAHAGRLEEALVHLRRAQASAERAGDRFISGFVRSSIGHLAAIAGVGDPVPALHDAISHLYDTRNWANLWGCLEAMALYWAGPERAEVSAIIIGYLRAHGIWTSGPGHLGSDYEQRRQDVIAALEADDGARELMARGAVMARDEVVAHALRVLEAELHHRPDPVEARPA